MTEFIPSAAERVALATREVERRMRNQPGPRARWFKHKGKSFALQLYELTLESPGEKDTIAWDADAGAFFVWGQPVDETAEPMVIDGEADVEKLWITAQYSDAEQRVDGLSSFAVGHRVYTTTRNSRREIVAPQFHDPRWEIVENNQGSAASHGHAFRVTHSGLLVNDGVNSDRVPLLDVQQGCTTYDMSGTDYWQLARLPMVNSPRSIADDFLGRATFACDRPAWAAVSGDLSSTLYAIGRPLGPAPGSWLFWPGLPGFVSLGQILTDDDGVKRMLVMRDLQSHCWWAKASADWVANGISPYILAYPCSAGQGSQAYDGTGDYLTINMKIELPKMGSQEDPNLHDGDYFLYTVQGISDPSYARGSPFVGHGDYLDGHLGEIRFMTGAKPGWALADGSANSTGTGIDLVTDSPFLRFAGSRGGTGGSLVHSHTPVSSPTPDFAVGDYFMPNNQNHLPPYYELAPYERIP